ncbi:MAG TPA: hypothetical protein VF053_15935 [Streptosporangiales bacterium]
MATERHRPERRVARTLPGSAGIAVRRLFLLGVFVFFGWCGLALASGATASAAEQPGSATAQGSSSLLGTGAVGDVLDEATSAVRSVGNRPFGIVTVERSDQRSARPRGAAASGDGRTHHDATASTGADPAPHPVGATDRSVLDLVPVPVRGLADPGAGVPVDIAVSTVDGTLGHMADAPLRSVTGALVAPLDATVERAATGLAVVRPAVPTRHDAGAAAQSGRAGVRLATPAHAAAHMPSAGAPAPASADGATAPGGLRADLPTGDHHTPSAPAAGDAPVMPFGVAGGSASGGSSGGNAGASGTYLDFAGVRPSAASGPVWTVRQNDEQVPSDDPDRPRVSPD